MNAVFTHYNTGKTIKAVFFTGTNLWSIYILIFFINL
nr:MAG TPA: hypothetical protein [Bacteriophage sp.]